MSGILIKFMKDKIKKTEYVFGPVFSRRLGRSLGIDLAPMKTCSYDCIYCQLGRTSRFSAIREEFIPIKKILSEIKRKLKTNPDFITITGSGEPTLYLKIGEVIDEIKKMTRTPLAVITNGSMLWNADVRMELKNADIVMPSLCAFDEASFKKINRPEKSLSFKTMFAGLKKFCREYDGEIWLEVFITKLFSDGDIKKLAALAKSLRTNRIQINTTSRPPSDKRAASVEQERLKEIAKLFGKKAEIIASAPETNSAQKKRKKIKKDDIVALIARHPCAASDIARGLLADLDDIMALLFILVDSGEVKKIKRGGEIFYAANRK